MECDKHKGTELKEVRSEPVLCEACGTKSPGEVVGHYCAPCDVTYPIEEQPVVKEKVAVTPTKKKK